MAKATKVQATKVQATKFKSVINKAVDSLKGKNLHQKILQII